MKPTSLLFLTFFSLCYSSFSQDILENQKYIFEFRDGTTIIGTFLYEKDGNIYINDSNGKKTYIPEVMIVNRIIANDDNIVDGEYWFPNLHDTRYFFAPTAFGLEEGEGYFSHTFWVIWQFQYGISDNFSVGAGTSPIGYPTTLNGKYSINLRNKLNTAFGYFWVGDLFNLNGFNDRSLVNMPYAVITKGTKETNITLGLGLNLSNTWLDDSYVEYSTDANGYQIGTLIEDEITLADRVTINTGATARMSRRFSVVFEGWLFDFNEDPILLGGPGIRYFRKINRVTPKNGAGAKIFDFQLLFSPEFDGPIPMFGASQKF